jgi:hypothetical protein
MVGQATLAGTRLAGAGEAPEDQETLQCEFDEPAAGNTAGLEMIMKVRSADIVKKLFCVSFSQIDAEARTACKSSGSRLSRVSGHGEIK